MALMTAFRHARGSYVVTMDADLQDNPEDIPALVARLDEGFDVVSGWRRQRNDGLVRTLGSRLFNRTVRAIGGPGIHDFNCGLKIFRSLVLKRVFVFGQHHRYIPLLAHPLFYAGLTLLAVCVALPVLRLFILLAGQRRPEAGSFGIARSDAMTSTSFNRKRKRLPRSMSATLIAGPAGVLNTSRAGSALPPMPSG